MIPRARLALWALAAAFGLWACGGEPPPAPAPSRPAPARAAAPAKPEAAEPEEKPAEPAFVYNPEGLRDPFQPFIRIEPKKEKKPVPEVFVPKTPLQRFAVEELRVTGIVWGEGAGARALVEAPDGKGYVVRVGTLVGDRGGRSSRSGPIGSWWRSGWWIYWERNRCVPWTCGSALPRMR